ncbi:hypothetical protein JR316_0002087 [Psilocybe cubensis]|uniref:Uncharacterized protein n=1 Tax=Psilocybe cubensis TaxID=181762 RepID=A0ACB8HDE4_PSICU|nr:hypothetical protein JR316_0002087 [Psilocybe cubensis]KAH9485180.1 hypothetical protein JR316_0002087 [Psilocybe cubensis]
MTSSGPSNAIRDMQCLFIPDDSTPERPIEEMNIHFPPGKSFGDVVCEVLQCERECPEILVTDEHLAVFNGHDDVLLAWKGTPASSFAVRCS